MSDIVYEAGILTRSWENAHFCIRPGGFGLIFPEKRRASQPVEDSLEHTRGAAIWRFGEAEAAERRCRGRH